MLSSDVDNFSSVKGTLRKFSPIDGNLLKTVKCSEKQARAEERTTMADAFYPFVGEGPTGIEGEKKQQVNTEKTDEQTRHLGTVVTNPARIAVFDDTSAAPRVVVVQPNDVRTYLEEITTTVTRLAKEQGGSISFTVIREVVENFVHAYFIEPTISILNGGNTIRFSDQGPGIQEKDRALEYGTTSATEEMKQYIRGVGSGLPYAQQYMEDHGGTLTIEDNLNAGTIVTISMPNPQAAASPQPQQMMGEGQMAPSQPMSAMGTQQMQPGIPSQAYPTNAQQPTYQQTGYVYPAQQGYAPQQPMYQQPYQGMGTAQSPMYQQQVPQQSYPMQQPYQQQPWGMTQAYGMQQMPPAQGWNPYAQQAAPLELSERDSQILVFLAEHESVGPTDLVSVYGGSLSTWTRQLKAMEERGLLLKDGQKRRLTDAGRSFLA